MAMFDHALPENETTKKLKSFVTKQHETDVVRHVGRELTLRGWDALGTRVEGIGPSEHVSSVHDILVRSYNFATQM